MESIVNSRSCFIILTTQDHTLIILPLYFAIELYSFLDYTVKNYCKKLLILAFFMIIRKNVFAFPFAIVKCLIRKINKN